MNEQEAIKVIRLDGIQMEGKAVRMLEFYEGLAMAEEALKKQIPKKPNSTDGFMRLHRCPSCNVPMGYGQAHCHCCGQKLDWTVEE